MKVAVTGATGFIGSNLVHALKREGHQVLAIVRDRRKAGEVLPPDVELEPLTLPDASGLRRALEGADGLVHLAALFNAPEASWGAYRRVNVDGTRGAIEAGVEAGVSRIVHCSTVGVAATGTPPFSEASPYSFPRSDKYEATKYEAEREALMLARERGAPVVVLRPAQVYGPGDRSKLKFYRMVRAGVIVDPKGTTKAPIYIDDLCDAFLRALTTEGIEGETFIASSPEPVLLSTMVEMAAATLGVPYPRIVLPRAPVLLGCMAAELLFGAVGRSAPVHRRSMDFFTKSVAFNVSKAERMLGFRAPTPLRSGMERTVAWYRAEGLL